MTTHELIKTLREAMDSEYIQENDSDIINLLDQAADKLEQLQGLVDDMLGDHYVDYLEFYTNRCRELEEQAEAQLTDIYKLAIDSDNTCDYCKHHKPCKSKECEYYVEGRGAEDQNGYMHDWELSCEDFDYGTCPMLEDTHCHGCIRNNYRGFEYKGT